MAEQGVLLLYDTNDSSLAVALRDFCRELGVNPLLIQLEPNEGRTVEGKEDKYFDNCAAAIFLITPRSPNGDISRSVAIEIGRAKEKFKSCREKIIYLADARCPIATIDQQARNVYDRADIDSIFRAFQVFIADLKKASLLGRPSRQQQGLELIDLEQVMKDTVLCDTLVFMSQQRNGIVSELALDSWLTNEKKINIQRQNVLKVTFVEQNLAQKVRLDTGVGIHMGWKLTILGVKLAAEISQRSSKAAADFVRKLILGKTVPGNSGTRD